jgi:hypothetical protein
MNFLSIKGVIIPNRRKKSPSNVTMESTREDKVSFEEKSQPYVPKSCDVSQISLLPFFNAVLISEIINSGERERSFPLTSLTMQNEQLPRHPRLISVIVITGLN